MPNPVGRPRTWDRELIQKQLIEWSKLETSTNLCGFCGIHLIPGSKITDWAREDEEFRVTYDIVRQTIADRREKMLAAGLIHVKAYDLNSKTYDHFMKMESRDEMKYASDLRKDETKIVTDQAEQGFVKVMDQLSSIQSSLKADANNINKDK